MKILFVATLSMAFSSAVALDDNDPLSCVDPTIAAVFLSGMGYQGVPEISKAIPEKFEGIQKLDGLSHVGTSETNRAGHQSLNLGVTSTLSVAQTQRQLKEFLNKRGWKDQQQPNLTGGGFKASSQISPIILCSETHGMLNVIVREFEVGTIANLMSYGRGRNQCGDQAMQAHFVGRDLYEFVPSLELPPGATVTPTYDIGMSSSSNVASTKASFSVDMSSAKVLAHFDQQIEKQGWSLDSGWEGEKVSGSAWVRSKNDNLAVGVLTLIAEAKGFAVRFEVQSM